jgi:hypothetical protein
MDARSGREVITAEPDLPVVAPREPVG